MSPFLGLLTLLAAAADAAVLALAAIGWVGRSRRARRQLRNVAVLFTPHCRLRAALVALTATAGGLFYSEVAGVAVWTRADERRARRVEARPE
ncbi:MAG: hypothetical protein ACRDHD_04405, partial [Candidatus Limnocylindria bacterium]